MTGALLGMRPPTLLPRASQSLPAIFFFSDASLFRAGAERLRGNESSFWTNGPLASLSGATTRPRQIFLNFTRIPKKPFSIIRRYKIARLRSIFYLSFFFSAHPFFLHSFTIFRCNFVVCCARAVRRNSVFYGKRFIWFHIILSQRSDKQNHK